MNAYRMKLAEDLINTYDTFLDEPEHLQTPSDLKRFLQEHNLEGEVDEAALIAARDLRGQLRAAWTAEAVTNVVDILNPLLIDARITLKLVVDEKEATTCQTVYLPDPTLPVIKRLSFEAALGISEAVQAYSLDRMRACEAEPCRDVFIDVSRNGSRRFCSERCANRYNVQAFRARKQE